MQALLAGRDVLAVMPTGSGKSAIYQVPGLLLAGPTVVVSPLLCLQHDQVDHLREHGLAAVALNSLDLMRQMAQAGLVRSH
jgi:ATP-dependent DNA helicase RecQ